ncbi:hypothetical protein AB434_0794 [Heyndrickxia coagulans]|uniref:Uncharacterized protein n=1 Tax=Heyndrickxia coagulans TaxID=1398 RepID=A0AAN0W9Z9_HEYCO|nr:hypothetical protein SB48_HM08orf00567 [Heyndrickxia coagulans]AKN53199.1 hypothetical protein AB434_0794 [Heyndrickxia coagulans]
MAYVADLICVLEKHKRMLRNDLSLAGVPKDIWFALRE